MFPLMFVAIAAGLGTAAAVAPVSLALAVVSAPFGGSFAALATALYLARRNGAERGQTAGQDHRDVPDQTDSLVAALRSLETHEHAKTRPSAAKPGAKRNVA
jgi:hypothetical protein